MSENTETTYDPFADADKAAGDTLVEDAVDIDDVAGEFDDILDGMDLDEEASGEVVKARDARKTYVDPSEVGLVDKMWVPIEILTAEAVDRHTPRLSSKVCIARKDGKVFAIYDQVEAALRVGAEEVIGEVPLPYFLATANHIAPRFGHRRFDWEIEVPVYTVKTALFEPRNGRTGYKNESGHSLRQATGAVEAGERVNKETMHTIADRMVSKVVMAQISMSKKAKLMEARDKDGKPVEVLVDSETGSPVKVFQMEDGTGYVVEDTAEVWEGDEKLLYPVTDRLYAIRDNGESSDTLKVPYYQDYINPPFQPVPDRNVTVETLAGDEVEGEITWDTVGAITLGKAPGVKVKVLLKNGIEVTASWFGTQWIESEATDEFSGS